MKTSSGNSWRNVGGRIHSLRKENCLTLKQLARGCDLSANTISLIEHGQVAPTIETLCKIAHALGVPAGSLFEEVCQADDLCASAGPAAPHVIFEPHGATPAAGGGPSHANLSDGGPDGRGQPRLLCVSGRLDYEDGHAQYSLAPGDSLVFAGGPTAGQWRNASAETTVAVVILPPEDNQPLTPVEPPALYPPTRYP